jgi:hypothetical protein
MTARCSCTINPNTHDHRHLPPSDVALLIGRPVETVRSWAKRGKLAATGEGYGQLRVCVCCASMLTRKASVRWVKPAGRRIRRRIRSAAA